MVKHQFCLSLSKQSLAQHSLQCRKKTLQDKVNIFASIVSLRSLHNPSPLQFFFLFSLNAQWQYKATPYKAAASLEYKKNAILDKIVRRSWYFQLKAAFFMLHLRKILCSHFCLSHFTRLTSAPWMGRNIFKHYTALQTHFYECVTLNDGAQKMFKRFHISLTKAHDNGSEGSSKIHTNELIFVRISLSLNITRTRRVMPWSDYRKSQFQAFNLLKNGTIGSHNRIHTIVRHPSEWVDKSKLLKWQYSTINP